MVSRGWKKLEKVGRGWNRLKAFGRNRKNWTKVERDTKMLKRDEKAGNKREGGT